MIPRQQSERRGSDDKVFRSSIYTSPLRRPASHMVLRGPSTLVTAKSTPMAFQSPGHMGTTPRLPHHAGTQATLSQVPPLCAHHAAISLESRSSPKLGPRSGTGLLPGPPNLFRDPSALTGAWPGEGSEAQSPSAADYRDLHSL